jgi:hypothetical protein
MNLRINILLALRFIWELPQNITGMLVFVFLKNKDCIVITRIEHYRFFIETKRIAVSLGSFVFWTKAGNRFPDLKNDCRMHEYGHTRQSLMFGPLYLAVIGLPSLARVFYRRWYRKKYNKPWTRYFDGYPENWADKLGGIVR